MAMGIHSLRLETPIQGQRFFAPEVVQTSAMDCGPAALKCILEGFNLPVSYGRLREACQTDVDGTSINTVEDIAVQLGLEAEQVMLPLDHLALAESQALPAIVVVQRPNGLTHFLVVWNRIGNFLQVMDPASGRRWPTLRSFQKELYQHSFPVSAQAWREWAGTSGMTAPLRRRLLDFGLPQTDIDRLVKSALDDQTWKGIATLDAATRMTGSLVRAHGLQAGVEAGRVLERFIRLSYESPSGDGTPVQVESAVAIGRQEPAAPADRLAIPAMYWSVLPLVESETQSRNAELVERLLLRGAVLVRILGRRAAIQQAEDRSADFADGEDSVQNPDVKVAPPEYESDDLREEAVTEPVERAALPPDLQAALKEPVQRPEQEVWQALRQDGLLTLSILGGALFLATLGVLIEALLFQGMIRIGQGLPLPAQRILATAAGLLFIAGLLFLEFPIGATVLRMGRRLETRLRIAFLEKIPRLGDRYFRSRLTSDMTQRAYDLRTLRSLPGLGTGILRAAFQLLLTMIGVIWLDPISALPAILGTLFFIGLALAARPLLEEHDLRLRTHTGALSHFYLDALLGLTPIRTHGAERAMRRQHEATLYEWVRTGRETYTWAAVVQAVGTFFYSIFAILILLNYLHRGGEVNEILLLFYWTLSLPALGQSLAQQIQQYPMQRNMVLRLLEPLSAPDEEEAWAPSQVQRVSTEPPAGEKSDAELAVTGPGEAGSLTNGSAVVRSTAGTGIAIQQAWLQAGGHVILNNINLKIDPGEHIAIVGPSGAGKSSLVGLLLGWHRPSVGWIEIDGQPLDGQSLPRLRRRTAWVDPAVQLWNRSLYDNLRYGIEGGESQPISEVIHTADLFDVLERLPEGLKTDLGEGGGLVSGGEGQRVRLGRAMLRPEVDLVILDEPFRGLDREKRRALLAEARRHWAHATLLCVTHDVGETTGFPRVLVIENGAIAEDGSPDELLNRLDSHYRSMLEAEAAVRRNLWSGAGWRRLVIDDGRLSEQI